MPDEKDIVEYIHKKNQHIIESTFVYKLDDPIRCYHKKDFNISDSKFVIAIVGSRLSIEIDDYFISIINDIFDLDPDILVVFMGIFDDYDQKKEVLGFQDRVINLGYQSDLRGMLNIADIYLNPIRKGGGTSAVEALAEEVPVITLANCDVAYAVGCEFQCDNIESVFKTILKYKNDRNFYNIKRKLAKERASQVINTESVIKNVLNSIK